MDFQPSKKIQEIIQKITVFVDQELIPLDQELLKNGFRSLLPVLKEKREKVKKMGLWAPNHPKELGGMGLNLIDHGLVSEALGRTPIGHYVFNCQAPDAGNIELLHKYGTDEQKEKYLNPLVQGEIRSCFGMTERNTAGSNPTLLDFQAVREGDEYVLSGEKWFTSSADGSAFCIVMAITNPTAAKHARASMILVPTDTPGFTRVCNTPMMGHHGEDWFSHAEIKLENCRVPVTNLLGPEGMGFVLAQDRLGPGRIHHCMRWIGVCNRAFEMMCERVSERMITSTKTLSEMGIVQGQVAESAAEIQAARLMVLHAAWMIETVGAKAARDEISMIKYYVANVMQRVVDRAIQVHGALGMTDYTILSLFYREERAARIYDGPDEVHKVSVAKRILKNYPKNK
ncbi:MAG: acyl-CoA dehydrogenase [bacterium]|jgi:acyl-CoA dehydrogenase